MVERFVAVVFIILLLPVLAVLSLLIVLFDGMPVLFFQKRVGRHGKHFFIWKFRTMRVGAEKEKEVFMSQNEADGPVFKIRNDPRLTGLGSFLGHIGVDEMPQLFNIARGEMSFVGPRPLPVDERNKIAKKYLDREKINPGILSPWIFNGYHNLGFDAWMKSDLEYVNSKNMMTDLKLCLLGGVALTKMVIMETRSLGKRYLEKGAFQKLEKAYRRVS